MGTSGQPRRNAGPLAVRRPSDQSREGERAGRRERVFESHPELAFCALAGRPMEHGKKRHVGRLQRLNALRSAVDVGGGGLLVDLAGELEAAERRFRRSQVGVDDLLDACVMLWVAVRMARGETNPMPANPPVDRCGLRIEMWF